jgi:hypothetical protein
MAPIMIWGLSIFTVKRTGLKLRLQNRSGPQSRMDGNMRDFLKSAAYTWQHWSWIERITLLLLVIVLYVALPSALLVLR